MIRREVQFDGGSPHWLLISQVEHARVSWLLASHASGHFGMSLAEQDADAAERLRDEVLDTIMHHDDGWAEWEAAPRIDPHEGRPLSFRELPLDEAVPIWDESITAAERLGHLPAWTVAGHFAALLASSEHHATDLAALDWQHRTDERRQCWFDQWQQTSPLHTRQLADEALGWLQLFDLWSLWLASMVPIAGEQIKKFPEAYAVPESLPLVREFQVVSEARTASHPIQTIVNPWPLDVDELTVEASAWLVPVATYHSSEDLLRARRPTTSEWLLVKRQA